MQGKLSEIVKLRVFRTSSKKMNGMPITKSDKAQPHIQEPIRYFENKSPFCHDPFETLKSQQ